MTPADLPARIAAKIAVDPESGCWVWGAANARGHGLAYWKPAEGLVYAHRLTYHLLVDPSFPIWPNRAPRLEQSCRNPGCVNPDHLQLVSEYVNGLPRRIAAKIALDRESGCWVWTGSRHYSGYGHVRWENRTVHAHRLTYHLLADPTLPVCPGRGGSRPDLDHLCRNKTCVNPAHLEAVSHRENNLRGVKGVLGDHSSRFVGVSWSPQKRRWRVVISVDRRIRNLGHFYDEVAAAIRYDTAAQEHYGERTNERLGLLDDYLDDTA